MDKEKEAYEKGLEDGLTAFAWWRDGTQVLGDGSNRLMDILKDLEKLYNYRSEYK